MKIKSVYVEKIVYEQFIEIPDEKIREIRQSMMSDYEELIEYYHSFEDFFNKCFFNYVNMNNYYEFNSEDVIDSELEWSEDNIIEED